MGSCLYCCVWLFLNVPLTLMALEERMALTPVTP